MRPMSPLWRALCERSLRRWRRIKSAISDCRVKSEARRSKSGRRIECGMDCLGDALAKLSATPVQVAELVYGLSEEQLSWKPSPELFSMRENLWHLRDIDVEGYERRIRLILSEDAPKLSDVNGRKLAKERNYNVQPIDPAWTTLAIL